jgi:hypothetical protein
MLNVPRKLYYNADEERELAAQGFIEILFPYIPLRDEFQVMDAIRSYYQKNNIEYSSEQMIQKMVELQDVIDTILTDEYLAVREAPNVYTIKLTQIGRERKLKVSKTYLADLEPINILQANAVITHPIKRAQAGTVLVKILSNDWFKFTVIGIMVGVIVYYLTTKK